MQVLQQIPAGGEVPPEVFVPEIAQGERHGHRQDRYEEEQPLPAGQRGWRLRGRCRCGHGFCGCHGVEDYNEVAAGAPAFPHPLVPCGGGRRRGPRASKECRDAPFRGNPRWGRLRIGDSGPIGTDRFGGTLSGPGWPCARGTGFEDRDGVFRLGDAPIRGSPRKRGVSTFRRIVLACCSPSSPGAGGREKRAEAGEGLGRPESFISRNTGGFQSYSPRALRLRRTLCSKPALVSSWLLPLSPS